MMFTTGLGASYTMQPGSGPGLSYSSWDPYGAIEKETSEGTKRAAGVTRVDHNSPKHTSEFFSGIAI